MVLCIFLLNLDRKLKILNRSLKSEVADLFFPFLKLFITAVAIMIAAGTLIAGDYYITGTVTDNSGRAVPDAKVSMVAGSAEFASLSGSDGRYSIRVYGIYGPVPDLLEQGIPYPNPFLHSINIPFIINSSGDIRLMIYNLSGQKIREFYFPGVEAGSYQIVWDGRTDNGAPARQGLYIYTISFRGKSWSGRLLKYSSETSASAVTTLEQVQIPVTSSSGTGSYRIPVITTVTCKNYYPVRLTDITISRDTTINFEICASRAIPFRTQDEFVAMHTGSEYRPLNLKGINLGSSPPGTFPGEIAYAITGRMYENWINRMAEAGFNSIRVYTLHPPVFYEKLANYNFRNPGKPLLLFQGIWLGEIEDGSVTSEYDLTLRTTAFRNEIREVIDCIHGGKEIAFRLGRAYGSYRTDISRWTAGFVIGREIMPQEVDTTNKLHPSMTSFTGNQLSITGATASEVFVTRMLDETVTYEYQNYSVSRPVSISSWPTLDPLNHQTEIYTDEDKATYDITKINRQNLRAGIFACYHAYPYYPNFISEQPSYRTYSDSYGPDSYLGYLTDLKNHYGDIPLVIGEFGVPSSWGSAHQSYSNMHHGGYSEYQQGERNLRMLHNIFDAGCAGGFIFSWMDEWFKPTWIVSYLEAYGLDSNSLFIPTRQLWHNLTSPEQNFGLITFEQKEIPSFIAYKKERKSGHISKMEATHSNDYFHLNIELDKNLSGGDTVMVAFDTYLSDIGESRLPNGRILNNRSEFLLIFVTGEDSASYYVTEAYNMKGFTPRFNFSDPAVQKYKSIVSDGAPWKIMEWINDGFSLTEQRIGRIAVENGSGFTSGKLTVAAWNGNKLKVRIPWTMLHFYDPTQRKVVNGATSYDGGRSYKISTAVSDGIAISVYYEGSVTSGTSRYLWDKWLVVPETVPREKKSLQIVEAGLADFAIFAD
ncbi:MAG TPA: hypothetical protein DDW27_05375 [Bacteroidales bacterium]|nr:hypothetical protein [Bacteroidales bacterium]